VILAEEEAGWGQSRSRCCTEENCLRLCRESNSVTPAHNESLYWLSYTSCRELQPPGGTDSPADNQKSAAYYGNWWFGGNKTSVMLSSRSLINPVDILITNWCKERFNIIIPSVIKFPEWTVPSVFTTKFYINFSFLSLCSFISSFPPHNIL
jgi:hypothetical protein